MQNLKADQGGSRGDALDYGYHGSDGTATVSFETRGYDWSGNELGMLQTEQYYASAPFGMTYTQAMNINGWGSMGGIVFPQPILKGTDAHTGLYGNGSAPGAPNLGAIGGLVGGVADVIGKIWNIPNDIIGLGVALASGAQFDGFGNNGIQFTGANLSSNVEAITFGNVQVYNNGYAPGDYLPSGYTAGVSTYIGYHEQGHTYQYQILGPLFLPLYGLGALVPGGNAFEHGADNWALANQPPPPRW
jgi:hypothetical protein